MFFPKFIFFKFLIFVGIINVNCLYVKFKFNLKFKCGDELANGRLMVNYRKAMYSGYTNVLDVVVINGIFKKDVVVPFPRSSKYSFDVLFRTNCFEQAVLNGNKKCCAQDFKFLGCSHPFTGNDFICGKLKNEGCKQKNSWIISNYNKNDLNQTKCEFKFFMNNPKTGQNYVDLKDLLVNASTYQRWAQMDSCNKYSAYQVSRSCVENNSNKFYSSRENSEKDILKEGFEQMEEICDYPKYGLVQASFERDEEWQRIDVTHPNNNCDVDNNWVKNWFKQKRKEILKKLEEKLKEIFS